MTKTKKQLRAEAVERLKNSEYHTVLDDVCSMLGWGHEPHFEGATDALIDLLTDDDATTESLSDEADSRERLEADIIDRSEQCRTILGNLRDGLNTVTVSVDVVRGWLDRQAAITSKEWCYSYDALEEELERVRAERDELRGKMEAEHSVRLHLAAEREELREENEALREWKACYERMRDERDEYREKFGKALDLAHEIGELMP